MPTRLLPASFAGHRVLVVGEAIVDHYQLGRAERISREAPVPVVSRTSSFARCGGSANAAANVAALGSAATLVAACGEDEGASKLAALCEQAGIEAVLAKSPEGSTAIKTRILAANQQLLRIDDCQPQDALAAKVVAAATPLVASCDIVLLSDYGLGLLEGAPELIAAASKAEVPVVVDPRGSDWSRYAGASVLTPNLAEFAAASANLGGDDAAKAQRLLAAHKLKAIVLTAGSAGMIIHEPGKEPLALATHNVDVYDVTGAGDTVAATLSLGLAAGAELEEAARWANLAAGIAVGRLGAVTVTPEDLAAPSGGTSGRVVAAEQLAEELDSLRAADRRIVMTNGCFDIFHAGHLQSLATAARLGDVLVVGVNDDASVTALKGPARPVIALKERALVLAGLGCVDFVTAFGGADACELIELVRPDVYVKGDDWADRQPPEAEVVRRHGGRIVFQASREHVSTTKIIDNIIAASKG